MPKRAINPGALREIRNLLGIEQTELARRCGITQGHLSNIESGKRSASPPVIRALASHLGVGIDVITTPAPMLTEPAGTPL